MISNTDIDRGSNATQCKAANTIAVKYSTVNKVLVTTMQWGEVQHITAQWVEWSDSVACQTCLEPNEAVIHRASIELHCLTMLWYMKLWYIELPLNCAAIPCCATWSCDTSRFHWAALPYHAVIHEAVIHQASIGLRCLTMLWCMKLWYIKLPLNCTALPCCDT